MDSWEKEILLNKKKKLKSDQEAPFSISYELQLHYKFIILEKYPPSRKKETSCIDLHLFSRTALIEILVSCSY